MSTSHPPTSSDGQSSDVSPCLSPSPAQSLAHDALVPDTIERRALVVSLQSELTACAAVGPDNHGPGELEKTQRITAHLTRWGITDLRRVDAIDPRATGGIRPNLAARLPGKHSRTLWLFAHTDVVPPGELSAWTSDPFQLRCEGDMLYGRGVEDNQQGLVSMLLTAEALKAASITPELTLGMVFMADEETGNHFGLTHMLTHAPELFGPDDLYIVPDAGSPAGDTVEVAEKSVLWLKVTVTGEQCHGSTPHKGRNAFLAASQAALALHDLHTVFAGLNPLFDPPVSTITPSKHEANVPGINMVPGHDVFYVDCRLLPEVNPNDVLEAARKKVAQAVALWGATARVEVEHLLPASTVDTASPVVDMLSKAVRDVYHVSPRPVGIGGSTVAALLRHRGLPAVVWSCIQNSCHQPNEHSSISATIKDARVFAHILLNGSAHA